jgi:hypothetical protein
MKAIFPMTEMLHQIVEYTQGETEFRVPYGGTDEVNGEPCLWLVHDQGLYLMSGAAEQLRSPDGKHSVVYAKGCNPYTDSNYWDFSRLLVGGDDFVDRIPLESFVKAIKLGAEAIELEVTATEIIVHYEYRKGVKREDT